MQKAPSPPKQQFRKTELCRNWEEHKDCPHYRKGNCAFAHGAQELQLRERPQNYKTNFCKHYWESAGPPGCRFGKRCRFIHDIEETKAAEPQKLPRRLAVFDQIAGE
jgi:hypothetical protein